MQIDAVLVLIGALGLVIGALSARIRRIPVSEPLIALVTGVVVGSTVLSWFVMAPLTLEHETLQTRRPGSISPSRSWRSR